MITGTAPAAAPAAWQDAALCSTKIIDTRDEVDASGRAFVCYALEATGVPPGLPKEEMRWLVRKRYTEFYQFYKDLFAASKSVPEIATFKFPHKSLFHNHDPRTIERRKRSFEELMSLALAVQPALLLRFLSESAPEQCVLNSDSPARASSASPDLTRMISDTYADRVSGFGSPSSGPSIAEVDGENSIPMRPIPEDEPMEFSRALLRVRRIEATQLKKVDLLGDNDPFVTLAFDKWRGRTRTLTNGGQNVSWDLAGDKKFEFDVTMDAMERLELRLAAHDDNDISSSEEIGKGALSLSGILTRGMDVEISASVRLVDSKNRFAGHVVIYFDLVEHPEDIATNMRRMNETGVAISLFYIFLYEVCLLIYVLWSFDYSKCTTIYVSR